MTNQSEQDFWGQESPKREHRKTKQALVMAIVMVIVFAVFGLAGFKVANHWLGGPGIVSEGETGDPGEGGATKEQAHRQNILILGIDQRHNEPARADTIILTFLDLENKNLKLLSIPRDTYVKIPGRGQEKIAHANAYGGPELTVETVENLLGINIDRYVEINFEGFKNMIETLGGIEMEVEKRMYYPQEDIDLHPGLQRLNGHDALAYVRFRNDTLGDIGRIQRQQKFLKELAEETLRLGTIFKLPELIKEANQSIDTNISGAEMLTLAKVAKAFDTSTIEAATLPGTPQKINKLDYWVPTTKDIQDIIEEYTNPKQTAETEAIDTAVN